MPQSRVETTGGAIQKDESMCTHTHTNVYHLNICILTNGDPHWTSHNNSLHFFITKKKKETFTQHPMQADRLDVDESEREESRIKAKFLI